MRKKTSPAQDFFDFDEPEAAAPVAPVLAPRAPSKREQHLEQIRRDMAVIQGPEHFHDPPGLQFYLDRVEMHRRVIKAMDAEAQSPASI